MRNLSIKYCIWVIGMMVLAFAACKKREPDIDLTDPVPQVLGVTIPKATVVEYQDSLVFLVEYRDNDGDLGENSATVHNLFLVDNRINVTEEFRIRQLAPTGAEIPITGILRVVLRNTGITDQSNSQSYNYTVYLRDRAGHESTHYITDLVTVNR